ncbi:bifunctional tRNA (5-methylaminomethyl-2-thiouridine)(34)-methyltransferase MnmD/FAD-dependent 5-carboxymethylaminomethyl-2-thiouridine(34) oxidoreductase MnmC [Silvimonas sp.]|uniref:bifunctional tRNA (5-methylaminomethyl-2-thiouridine)(34)-methyltransferase MnmD/FAD-dependent 5-carboxymethylaminomethyl-2-thiouridine(34) oxidoreductase MnmC n=1 Tax=Silvimonas sp. TaxID=2650811 RepID=UPI00283EA269|nr:bifunctional tRNA (5-methylaminomethyl-2-thiouridine)(34)-methyltransferase MnmD/FAD-dependent 5-carboxymethylaminomethyl-2-thiouridine(34) oxidoreductase MnmC [Silvimonas sp.]MDR3426944.1 bifunctional tRNA (5-methylaminomethyl-2-thiouridine)(34)-methyltransferase MnmD/FAD-dependent 5-carboxymethylaminomethyl-2-thiouridine(34) oxidoreductase MnmC [Silvimonas sp.]
MPYPALVPAQLVFSPDGIPYSSIYGDVYHSDDGGEEQVRSVFMAGNGLPERWRERSSFTIVETGFGQGLSFLVTWQAWQNDPQRSDRLHFVSVEKHPFTAADMAKLHARYPELATLSQELLTQWPLLTPGFHRLHLDGGRVTLTLLFGEAADMLQQLTARIDAIYLDGFSPDKNTDIWSGPVIRALWRNSGPGTTLASYTVARAVRDELTVAGFSVRKEVGFGRKRQRLAGQIERAPRRAPVYDGPRQAVIVGAGMAGCAAAERLAARGWQVTVLDKESAPAQAASGNHVGLMHAHFSRDDNLQARLTRAGSEYTLRHLTGFSATTQVPSFWGLSGVFQVAKSAEQAEAQAAIVQSQQWPADLLDWRDAAQAQTQFGVAAPWGGWWFARGAWARPASLCRASLARFPQLIRLVTNAHVAELKRTEHGWQLLDASGNELASAPIVILAQATAALELPQAQELPLSSSLRSTTLVAAGALPEMSAGLSGSGYVTPQLDGWHCIGAAAAKPGEVMTAESANLQALGQLFAQTAVVNLPTGGTRLCARPNSLDRMPLVGELPQAHAEQGTVHQLFHIKRQAGLYGLLGLGSRGLTYASLCAEVLAAELNAEPAPLERALLDAIDPARFLLRAMRKGSPWPLESTADDSDDDDQDA